MRYGSLCSGIGGLDRAIETVWPGAAPAWFCEYDAHAASVLRRWWPGVPVLPDLKTQDWSTVEPVELVTAGYPCQPFSQAGQRRGSEDPRHLWPFVIDAVRVLRPRLVVLENVAGHLGLGFDIVLGDLAEAGFDADWCVVPASAAGACHRRERLFVVAEHPGYVARGPEHGQQPDARAVGSGQSGEVVAPDADGGRLVEHHEGERRVPVADMGRSAAPDARGERHGRGQDGRALGRVDRGDAGEARQRERARTVPGDRSATTPADSERFGLQGRDDARGGEGLGAPRGEPAGAHPAVAWGDYEPAIRRWEHVIGRPAPAPTDEQGRLNVPFVEWMQGFDAGWVDDLGRTAALRCLGNAVVQQQGVMALEFLRGAS